MPRSRPPFPSLEQVLALPSAYSLVVPDDYLDGNGHMNIARYMQIHSDGGWAYFAQVGMSEEVARAGGPTSFDVEHHIVYRREVHAGDEVSVHVRVIDRTERALHSLQYLVNRTRGEVANTHEAVSLCVDLATRKLTTFTEEVARDVDAQLAVDRALGWEPQLHMSLRR